MTNFYSYVVARDFGFAPNPFHSVCTLATCKWGIRKSACVNDWIFGTGSKKYQVEKQLVFAMKISEKISYDQYWSDSRFQLKKPIMNGSLKRMYGDNIYNSNLYTNDWSQVNSHHSNQDGTINYHNLNRDTKANAVLISNRFYYFGNKSILIPNEFSSNICVLRQGYKLVDENVALKFIDWLASNYKEGYKGDPLLFNKFSRYKGIS